MVWSGTAAGLAFSASLPWAHTADVPRVTAPDTVGKLREACRQERGHAVGICPPKKEGKWWWCGWGGGGGGAHSIVEDTATAAQHLHEPHIVLPHHGVACHHNVNVLAQQLVQNLRSMLGSIKAQDDEIFTS